MKKIALLALMLLAVCLFSLPAARTEDAAAQLTLMIYMTGSNLESEAGAATLDLEEMRAALPEDGALQVVILAGGASHWNCGIDPDGAAIYRLTKAGLELCSPGMDQSMGDPATLTRLLTYGREACPAERYALILWDHGAGPMIGLCFDENHKIRGDMDGLTLAELQTALQNSPFSREKLDWIGFDACLMASIETACAVAPYANYMIASQEAEPTGGWSYGFLAEAAREGGAQTGRRVMEEYAACYRDSLADITLSCVDLSRVDEAAAAMTALFGDVTITPDNYAAFASARSDARTIGCSTAYDYDLIDLIDLLEVYEDESLLETAELRALLDEAIVCSYANGDFRNGLSVYYPFYNKTRFVSPWSSRAEALNFSDGFRAFLSQTNAIWMGESLADWYLPRGIEADAADVNRLTLELTPEQAAQFSSARLVVIEEDDPGQYRSVYDTGEVELQGTTLQARYRDEALFFVDEQGVPTTGATHYFRVEDYLLVPARLFKPDPDAPLGEFTVNADLVYRQDDQGEYRLVTVLDANASETEGGKSTLTLEGCTDIWIASHLRIPTTDDEGQLLPLEQWDFVSMLVGDALVGDDPGTPVFLPLQDEEQRYAFFEITNLQGEVTVSERFSLYNKNRTALDVPPTTLLDDESCAVTLDAMTAVVGANPGLEVSYSAVNRTDHKIWIRFEDFWFNDTMVSIAPTSHAMLLKSGETLSRKMLISASALRDARVNLLHTLKFTVTCEDAEEKGTLAAEVCAIPLQVNTQALIYDQPGTEPLESVRWGDVEIALMEMDATRYGRPQALIRFSNQGSESIRFAWVSWETLANGVPCVASFSEDTIELPAGCDAALRLTFYNTENHPMPIPLEDFTVTYYEFDGHYLDSSCWWNVQPITLHIPAE